MKLSYRSRRIISVVAVLTVVAGWLIINPGSYEKEIVQTDTGQISSQNEQQDGSGQSLDPLGANSLQNSPGDDSKLARTALEQLEVKGRAPKAGYERTEFYKSWPSINGCSLRQIIIRREVGESAVMDGCDVIGGTFIEPYTGSTMTFYQKSDFSKKIQIDHVVALSDAWQKGAQYMEKDVRYAMATDPLNLLAVDAATNQQKSDGDAATWLPPNKAFRCQYVARQVSVKKKYNLWVTQAEHDAIATVLENCPNEQIVGIE